MAEAEISEAAADKAAAAAEAQGSLEEQVQQAADEATAAAKSKSEILRWELHAVDYIFVSAAVVLYHRR